MKISPASATVLEGEYCCDGSWRDTKEINSPIVCQFQGTKATGLRKKGDVILRQKDHSYSTEKMRKKRKITRHGRKRKR